MQRAGGRGCSQQDLLTCWPLCRSKSHHGHQVFPLQATLNAIPSLVWVLGPSAPQIRAICFFFGGEPDVAKHRFCLGVEGRVPTATASRNGNCVKPRLERRRGEKKKRSFHFNKAKVSPLNNRMSSVNTRRPQLSEIEVLH